MCDLVLKLLDLKVDYLSKLKNITQSINHRGPDALGFWNSINSIFLGTQDFLYLIYQRRKSTNAFLLWKICDFYNGEIYNFKN